MTARCCAARATSRFTRRSTRITPLGGDQPFATMRGEYLGNFGGAQESSRADIVQRGNSFEAEAFVPGVDQPTLRDGLVATIVVADGHERDSRRRWLEGYC